jgi:hypothetical protein
MCGRQAGIHRAARPRGQRNVTTVRVLAFPPARRPHFIKWQAAYAAELPPDACDRYIRAHLELNRHDLLRKGVDPEAVQREIEFLEVAIRHGLCRALFGGGAA